MKISILLPYKENFSPIYPGAVSLFVKDTTKISKYKKFITIFGNTNLKKIYKLNYTNIKLKKIFIQSGSKNYVKEFLEYEKKIPSDLINQLENTGIMIIPVGEEKEKQVLMMVTKDKEGKVKIKPTLPVRFVPML